MTAIVSDHPRRGERPRDTARSPREVLRDGVQAFAPKEKAFRRGLVRTSRALREDVERVLFHFGDPDRSWPSSFEPRLEACRAVMADLPGLYDAGLSSETAVVWAARG